MKKITGVIFLSLMMACGYQGPIGQQGLAGKDGTNGHDGAKGDTGASGHDGQNATPVTMVNLCPGVSTYPGVFVEIGICLQGKLYGVYSANGGFLTELPPGTYSSNAIGSACNLMIGANCVVTH